MTRQVYISGQIGKAIFEEGGRHYVVGAENPSLTEECRPSDLSLFFGFGAEFTSFSDERSGPDHIADALESQTKTHRALSLFLGGLDEELDNNTRSLAIEAS